MTAPTVSTWSKILFDAETDGLLKELTKFWCLVLMDMESGEMRAYVDKEELAKEHPLGPEHPLLDIATHGSIEDGVRLLDNAEVLVGQNIIDFDIPATRKLFPWAKLASPRVVDTLVLSRLVYPDIKPLDYGCYDKWGMPKQLIGRHGLEAWGYRLGLHKIDYKDWCKANGIKEEWAQYTPEMLAYCIGDVRLNFKLFQSLGRKKPPRRAVDLEMTYALIAKEMEHNGFPINTSKAHKLYADLTQRKAELLKAVAGLFDDWWESTGEMTVSRTRNEKVAGEGYWRKRAKGKTLKGDLEALQAGWHDASKRIGSNHTDALHWFTHEGAPVEFVPVLCEFSEGSTYTTIKRTEFNPQSRQHIADRLQKVYGWKPKEFGKNGIATLNDEILSELPFEPCKVLAEYFLIQKRLGQVAEGNQAWLKVEEFSEVHGRKAHRIHGRMNTIGTATFRCSHSSPNMGQVPSVENAEGPVPYGHECRELFEPEQGMVLVGCDASGLQLRALSHHLAAYDEGAYVEVVTTGDVHTANQLAAGLPSRAKAKKFIYTFLFGGNGFKLGFEIGGASDEEVAAALRAGGKGQQYALKDLEFRGLPAAPSNIATALKGFKTKASFTKKTPGLADLIREMKKRAELDRALVGLDGRAIPLRSPHSALNYALQSDEAIICKEWKVISWQEMHRSGLRNGRDFAVHADVHDEWQVGFMPEIAEEGGKLLQRMVTQAGINLGYRCPLAGEFKIGSSWAGTH